MVNSFLRPQLFNFSDVFREMESLAKSQVEISSDIEDNENYYLRALVPGFEEKELSVACKGRVLTLTGKHEKPADAKNLFASDIASFEKKYVLPPDVVTDSISAEYRCGILVITVPKNRNTIASQDRKLIPIKTSGAPD